MRFGTAPDRPHEDRPLRAGSRTASILISFQAQPDTNVEQAAAEIEGIVRALLDTWYDNRGHKLVIATPDVA